jgi:DNA polymerase-1
MLPGVHINWMDFTVTEVPPGAYDVMGVDGLQYGSKWFFLQLLQGDTADNIPGLPKLFGQQCGEARAVKYLAGTTDAAQAQDRVEAAYQDHYGSAWVDALIEQAALLWLRTDAQATIRNVAEAFPEPKRELLAGIDRLESRVTKELNALKKIGQEYE